LLKQPARNTLLPTSARTRKVTRLFFSALAAHFLAGFSSQAHSKRSAVSGIAGLATGVAFFAEAAFVVAFAVVVLVVFLVAIVFTP
jgi:Leu/Phe-tRNA-protein transferase